MSAATLPRPQRTGDAPPGGRATFAGTAALLRFAARRDRVRIPVWVLGVVGFVVGSAASLADLLDSEAERRSRAELMATPTIKAFRGPGYGLDDYTTGAMVAHELLLLAAVAVALMSVFLVVRHTRAEEETGRVELLRSNVVGAHAAPTAALLAAVLVNVVVGALLAVALQAAVDDLPATGSWAFGLATAAVGVVFAGVALLACQLTEHARGATGIASVTLAVAFVLRAVGDTGGVDDRALSWASPIGWVQSTRPFVDERWWPLLLCLALAALLATAALALVDRRDVGAGLVRPRPGPPRATDLLVRPTGLAFRLHRGAVVAWTAGLALLGGAFGAVIGDVAAFLDDNPQMEQVIGGSEGGLTDAFLATVVLVLALLATGSAITGALRMRVEEDEGRAEPLLATPLPRVRWAASHLAVVFAGGAAAVLAGAGALGAAAAIDRGDASLLRDLLAAGAAYVPAVWLTVGLVVALFGFAPRATGLAWAVLAHAVVVGLLGDVLDLPDALRNLSPLHHVPDLPAADPTAGGPVVLTAVAVGLVAAGLYGFHRRDVGTA